MSALTDEIIRQVRRISAELRPGVLDDLGLVAAIEWQAQEFEERTGTPCVVRANPGDAQLDATARPPSSASSRRRSRTSRATRKPQHVDVRRRRATTTRSSLEVRDDGIGITRRRRSSPKSLGLLGIRERARRLGGSVDRRPRRCRAGRVVALRVPLDRAGSAR